MDDPTLSQRLANALDIINRQNDLLTEALQCIDEYGEKLDELRQTHKTQMEKMFQKLKNK